MNATFFGLSIDAANPTTLATFWANALGRTVNDGASDTFAAVGETDGTKSGPFLMFHQVPETKTIKNRLHLDLITTEIHADIARLIDLGAVRLEAQPGGDRWTSFTDPEGNEFDLVAGRAVDDVIAEVGDGPL